MIIIQRAEKERYNVCVKEVGNEACTEQRCSVMIAHSASNHIILHCNAGVDERKRGSIDARLDLATIRLHDLQEDADLRARIQGRQYDRLERVSDLNLNFEVFSVGLRTVR